MTKYTYLGKPVEVLRFMANETAQLGDYTFVPVKMLHLVANDEAAVKKISKLVKGE